MKTIKTIQTVDLNTVTGGCAACGNPAHTSTLSNGAQQLGQQAGSWVGSRLGSWLGRR